MNTQKIKEIIDRLNQVQEELMSVPEDMLLSINPQDNESVEDVSEKIQSFNHLNEEFSTKSAEIIREIRDFYDIGSEAETMDVESFSSEPDSRIIRELDKTVAHSIDENFTYKRPYGFVLDDVAMKEIKTWKNLFIQVLKIMHEKYPEKFDNIDEVPTFTSNRGSKLFSKSPKDLRIAEQFTEDLYVEINLSAKSLMSYLQLVMQYLGYDKSDIKIYLREDRDSNE